MSVSDRLRQLRPSAGSGPEPENRIRPDADERSRTADKNVAGAVVRGVQAGVVATLIMTAFRLPIMRSLPPSANFWSQYVARDDDPDEHPVAGLALHLAYGIQGGAMFGALFELQDAEQAIEPEQRGLIWGPIYGMVLSALGSQLVLKELLGIQLEADELALFHAGHLVYGLSLGAWVGSRTEGAADPETEYEYDDGN
ncbi:hypothetical protein [Halopiger xanaduensis]|uniref:DUF1440 domain-containing protein n=1 Tax=Halopiger xanaduensis (strain DSM 18323 / JCM 14033 / SH-6) TaxID=797210 RepID=F8D3G6_HALXS|nr:hypothetical protein [Halopiger xanaduensis]AEH36192.1 hypothetical protein Halxa_1560 [Halopiger xanaduensis SH-6]